MFNKGVALGSSAKRELCFTECPVSNAALKQYHHFIAFPLKIKAEIEMQHDKS